MRSFSADGSVARYGPWLKDSVALKVVDGRQGVRADANDVLRRTLIHLRSNVRIYTCTLAAVRSMFLAKPHHIAGH